MAGKSFQGTNVRTHILAVYALRVNPEVGHDTLALQNQHRGYAPDKCRLAGSRSSQYKQ